MPYFVSPNLREPTKIFAGIMADPRIHQTGLTVQVCPDCGGPIEDNYDCGLITDLRCEDVVGCGWHITTDG